MRIRTIALASAALVTTALLAGCGQINSSEGMPGMDHGTSSASASPSAAGFNSADEMFATMMIPHHQQAVQMSDEILGKKNIEPDVRALAQQIKDAQQPEIDTMKGWLQDWGAPYDGSSSMDMGNGSGMMSDDDMTALKSASGAEATKLFLQGMIGHHQGAIQMARSELKDGQNADALTLAQAVIDGQSKEITTMQSMLGKL